MATTYYYATYLELEQRNALLNVMDRQVHWLTAHEDKALADCLLLVRIVKACKLVRTKSNEVRYALYLTPGEHKTFIRLLDRNLAWFRALRRIEVIACRELVKVAGEARKVKLKSPPSRGDGGE